MEARRSQPAALLALTLGQLCRAQSPSPPATPSPATPHWDTVADDRFGCSQPDKVHVLAGGRIVRSGDASLALHLEDKGYAWLEDEVA